MNQQRIQLLEQQSRAYCEGTIEYINNEWIFFDDETDEASGLEDYANREIIVYRSNRVKRGILLGNGLVQTKHERLPLHDQDRIKIKKILSFSLEALLDDLNDDAFFQFITTLNSLQFSIYDYLYCHNYLSFLLDKVKQGVNFLIFDNGTEICAVQHHFCYAEKKTDRFEYTLNSGRRIIIEKLPS